MNNEQDNTEGFWPNVSGFRVGDNKNGTGQLVMFTINGSSNSKQDRMLFEDFMNQLEAAFEESGKFGVRVVIPFREMNGPRGVFQAATMKIFPNKPPATAFRSNRGGGRREYPQQQGRQAPVQPQPQQRRAPQGTPARQGYAQPAPQPGGATQRGPTAPTSASHSNQATQPQQPPEFQDDTNF